MFFSRVFFFKNVIVYHLQCARTLRALRGAGRLSTSRPRSRCTRRARPCGLCAAAARRAPRSNHWAACGRGAVTRSPRSGRVGHKRPRGAGGLGELAAAAPRRAGAGRRGGWASTDGTTALHENRNKGNQKQRYHGPTRSTRGHTDGRAGGRAAGRRGGEGGRANQHNSEERNEKRAS